MSLKACWLVSGVSCRFGRGYFAVCFDAFLQREEVSGDGFWGLRVWCVPSSKLNWKSEQGSEKGGFVGFQVSLGEGDYVGFGRACGLLGF